jgi:lipopolysaccharide/colanic/teichoic acid biosynthesis glycosyltransferase
MSKHPTRLSNPNSNQASVWQLAGGRAVSLMITIFLVILVWFFMQRLISNGINPAGWILGWMILSALLAMALERSLVYLPLSISWRYRLAFLGSISLVFVFWIGFWSRSPEQVEFGWLIVVLLGSFFGSILATSLNERLWENNSPPSEWIMQDVHRRHEEAIGSGDATPRSKRAFDLILASTGLLLSMPVWFMCILLIWIRDPGPLLFVKNSVGKGGKNFHQFKLRTMVHGAEDSTGPVLAREEDERVLGIGRLLRKTALDELPQLLNILRGQMSFVGPRPQRTVLVQGYLREMPEYAQRHRVLPGLSGLAQVAGDYYLTPRQKLRFDRLCIEYTSLGFDLKLIALAFLITFWFRWQENWDGRLPRSWLRFGSRGKKVS